MSIKALNILYINHYDSSEDAAAISSYRIIAGLASIGHKVIVLTHDPYPNNETEFSHVGLRLPRAFEGSRFLKFLRCTICYLFVFLAGLKLRRKEKIDCIFSQHHNIHFATLTASILSAILNVPYVVKIQNGFPSRVGGLFLRTYKGHFMKALNRYALKRAKHILALSPELKDQLMKVFGVVDSQLFVIPNTVETVSVKQKEIKQMKRRLGLRDNRILIFVGSTKRRGVEDLIKAVPRIVSEDPDARALLVGPSSDYYALKRLAESSGGEEYIRFIGPIRHSVVPLYISMCDVAIGPLISFSYTTGAVPRKVLEYMACGKPVIACHGSVSQDLLVDNYNGILVKSGDINELSSAVIRLLKNGKFAKRIGSNAKKHVSKFYSDGFLVEKLITLTNMIWEENLVTEVHKA
ncbi:MAG: glycosyltransferase family 4 protein [Promethearchaeota archaeon]